MGWFTGWGRKLQKCKSENGAVEPCFSHIGSYMGASDSETSRVSGAEGEAPYRTLRDAGVCDVVSGVGGTPSHWRPASSWWLWRSRSGLVQSGWR